MAVPVMATAGLRTRRRASRAFRNWVDNRVLFPAGCSHLRAWRSAEGERDAATPPLGENGRVDINADRDSAGVQIESKFGTHSAELDFTAYLSFAAGDSYRSDARMRIAFNEGSHRAEFGFCDGAARALGTQYDAASSEVRPSGVVVCDRPFAHHVGGLEQLAPSVVVTADEFSGSREHQRVFSGLG